MKKGFGGFIVNEKLLSERSVANMLVKDGIAGMGRLAYVGNHLQKCYHTIAVFEDVAIIARKAGIHRTTLAKWIRKCGLFEIDDENKVFCFNYLRSIFGLKDITERELYLIKTYGNQIKKDPEECVTENKDEKTDNATFSKNSSNFSSAFSVKVEEKLQNQRHQHPDNKDVNASSIIDNDTDIYTNTNISNRNRNICNSSSNKESADADGDKSFKFFEEKIFSCTKWRKAVTESHGVNLTDDFTMHVFVRWMYSYCQAKIKKQRDFDDTLNYAANLLMCKRKTRYMFEKKLSAEIKAREEERDRRNAPPRPVNRGCFETRENGIRYGLGHLELPMNAPVQRDMHALWSYIHNRYIPEGEWQKVPELAAYRKWKNNQIEAKKKYQAELRRACNERLKKEEEMKKLEANKNK